MSTTHHFILPAILFMMGACGAAPPRHELRDGPMPTRAPVFVAPGYTPAGTGLPPEYLPGAPEPAVERSPHKRMLPPTREPTVFSGDRPQTSGDGKPRICGVEIPVSPIDPYDDLLTQVAPMAKCLQSILRRIDILNLNDRIEAIPLPERTCVVARMYAFCNQREMGAAGKEQGVKGAGASALSPHLVRTARLAEAFRAKSCDAAWSHEGDAIADLMERRWDVIETHGGTKR